MYSWSYVLPVFKMSANMFDGWALRQLALLLFLVLCWSCGLQLQFLGPLAVKSVNKYLELIGENLGRRVVSLANDFMSLNAAVRYTQDEEILCWCGFASMWLCVCVVCLWTKLWWSPLNLILAMCFCTSKISWYSSNSLFSWSLVHAVNASQCPPSCWFARPKKRQVRSEEEGQGTGNIWPTWPRELQSAAWTFVQVSISSSTCSPFLFFSFLAMMRVAQVIRIHVGCGALALFQGDVMLCCDYAGPCEYMLGRVLNMNMNFRCYWFRGAIGLVLFLMCKVQEMRHESHSTITQPAWVYDQKIAVGSLFIIF